MDFPCLQPQNHHAWPGKDVPHRLRQRPLATAAGGAQGGAERRAKRRTQAELEPVLVIGKLYLCTDIHIYIYI